MTDSLDYDILVDDALRGAVASALKLVERDGLPGDHHFYITFRTDHPRTRISDGLKARYPEEITIVMQHQFWNLEVDERGFRIGLSFNQAPQTLYIPFAAVTAFVDPSAKFGLKFRSRTDGGARTALPAPSADSANVVALDSFRKK